MFSSKSFSNKTLFSLWVSSSMINEQCIYMILWDIFTHQNRSEYPWFHHIQCLIHFSDRQWPRCPLTLPSRQTSTSICTHSDMYLYIQDSSSQICNVCQTLICYYRGGLLFSYEEVKVVPEESNSLKFV